MTADRLREHAARLRALHHGGPPLVLANAWDATSARIVEGAGFPVVATTSGGVAEALGYADREQTPPAEMFAAVARIAGAVAVPVTADIESGYGLDAGALVGLLLDAGAAGCNLEDSDHSGAAALTAVELQAERLAAVREAAIATGVEIVLNARVDVFLQPARSPEEQLDEALRRGRAYRDAGADCVYPIGVHRESDIAALVAGLSAPVNVLVRRGVPPLPRLAELGVRRISVGTGLMRATSTRIRELASALRAGDAAPLVDAAGVP